MSALRRHECGHISGVDMCQRISGWLHHVSAATWRSRSTPDRARLRVANRSVNSSVYTTGTGSRNINAHFTSYFPLPRATALFLSSAPSRFFPDLSLRFCISRVKVIGKGRRAGNVFLKEYVEEGTISNGLLFTLTVSKFEFLIA